MSILSKIRQSFSTKSVETIKHPGSGGGLFWRATKPLASQMAKDVGTGLGANVILSPIGWIQRNSVEAQAALRRTSDGEAVKEKHPLLSLLAQPNEFYSGAQLLVATIFSLLTAGNAYWIKQGGFAGLPKALWYTPHWLIEPKWPESGDEFISHYEYRPGGGTPQRLELEDVVHFRRGINPENTRLGLSPLTALLAEIWTDMEAGAFVGAIMHNGGVPGLLFSPRGKDNEMSSTDVEELKNYLTSQFSGENRGRPLVSSVDARIEMFGYDPSQLDLSVVRNTAEERVCAALGIPAAVVGFGTGLQQTKVGATMRELRKEAWIGGILPLLTSIAAEINRSLMPDFQASDTLEFHYDSSKVPALAEDRDLVEARIMKRVKGGVVTVNEARIELGLEDEPGQDVYLRPFSTIEVPQGTAGRQIGSEEEGGEPKEFTLKADLSKAIRDAIYGIEATVVAETKAHGPDDHSALERRVAENNRRLAKPPKALVALAGKIDRMRLLHSLRLEDRLDKFFDGLGKKAESVARRVIKSSGEILTKQGEAAIADQIVEGMALKNELPIFKDLFEKAYIASAEEVAGAMKATLGIEVGVTDPVARSILASAGRRAGLIDLSAQSKKAAFRSLVQSTAEGLGPEAAARRIRDAVGGGPWGNAATRAKVVARTEMTFATNVSSLELGKSIGATEAVVFDARLGPTDATCEALNGRVVSLSDARGLMFDEHPNGSRSFSPIPPTLKL